MPDVEGTSSVTLYNSPISDCCGRLRIALNLKNVYYRLINVNLKSKQNLNLTFAKTNASQTVPTLVHDKTTITQSLAALEYIDETFSSEYRLLPTDPAARAQVRTLVQIIATDTHPLLTHRVARAIDNQFSGADVKAWRLYWLERGLANFEAEVVKSAGSCCVGDSITLADVVLIPALWTAARWEIDLDQYPTVKGIYLRLSEMKEFKSAKQDPGDELGD